MTEQELGELHRLVHEAQQQVDRPWEPGETTRPITFFTDHLDAEGWTLGWKLVAWLRDHAPGLFQLFGEEGLHHAALSMLLTEETVPTIEAVVAALEGETAESGGPWLVCVPFANARLDRPWAVLGENAVLLRAPQAHRETDESARESLEREEFLAESEAFKHLGDRISPASRHLRLGSDEEIDTGREVSMLVVEQGSPLIAIESARAKAHYALAVWSVLAPPRDWHLLPDVGIWTPQPYLHQRTRHKRLEQGAWVARERKRGGEYRHWAPYDLPEDDVLRAPFEAFASIERRSAQALLSGSSALYSGVRATRSQLSERIRDARVAIECLCEEAAGSGGDVRGRWDRLAARFDVWTRLSEARSYTPRQITDLQRRITDARNISAHGSDAALIDLGWTVGDRPLRHGRSAPATDLAVTALQRDLGPLLFAIGEALRGAWQEMRAAGFDDDAFAELFQGSAEGSETS